MNDLPPEAPRLDPVPFIVADILLLGGAGFIVTLADAPLSTGIVVCATLLVGLGAVALLYPFVVNHARRQELALQERTRQIEALARTVAATAEQIGVAVANLPAIAENASRQLKAAEQLPAALKEQLSALQQQLSATASEENAALRHELDTLRGAETAKLADALAGLQRATADLARIEALASAHSTALDSAIAHLPRVAEAFGHQTREALHRETTLAVTALQTAAADAGAALEAASTEARVGFERGVRDAVAHLAKQASSNPPFPAHAVYRPVIVPEDVVLIPKPKSEPAPAPEPAPEPTPETAPAAEPPVSPTPLNAEPVTSIDDTGLDEPAAAPTPANPAPEDIPAATDTAIEEELADEIIEEQPAPAAEPTVAPEPITEPEPAEPEPAAEEETPAVAEPEPTSEPVSEPAAESEPEPVSESSTEEPRAEEPAAADTPATEPVADEDTSEEEPEPAAPEPSADEEPAPAAAEPALSHDGYTRLVATAYIGIGNKLFVRGDGPGLRRDKGVPLQFVSIGKWRWESAELLFPATVKLYKNDQQECVALGEITLEPGHHHEVNATF